MASSPPPASALDPPRDSPAPAACPAEARYRTLVEAAQDGVFVCDAEDRFVLVNPALEALCGRTASALLGRAVAEVLAPDDPAAPLPRLAALTGDGPHRIEWTLRRADGTTACVEVGLTPLDGGETKGLVRDVTDRRRMEEALRAQEQRFRGIFDSAFQFVGLLAPDGTLLEVNRTALEFVGRSAAHIVGKPFWDTPWWTHDPIAQQRVHGAVIEAAGGALVRFEAQHVSPDGRTIEMDVSLKPVRDERGAVTLLIAEGRDVTEERRATARLRRSEALFRSAFEHSGIGMALVGLDGRWLRVNRALCDIVGYDEPELLERSFQDITHPDDLDSDLAHMRELHAGVRASYQLEKRYLHKDGRVVWALLNGSAVRDENGAPCFYIAQVQDISARKANEEALARRSAELARSNAELQRSNAELEQFAYVASHDLQEPLRMIASYTQLLHRRYEGKLDADADRYIHFAVEGAQRMQALILDLLTLSRVGAHRRPMAPTDVNAVLGRALRALRSEITATGAVVTAEPLPTVRADATELDLLFQNLLGNAVKFRRPGAAPHVHVSAEALGEVCLISVRDDGIGFEQQFAEQIFVIFQRLHTRSEYPGTGIGLAICRKIVERHGGRIWVESAPGQGATFHFTLPRSLPDG